MTREPVKQRRSLHKRNRILQAAIRAYGRHGYEKTTVADIARRAGVGKATIYYHFRGKDHIFEAAVEREIEAFFAELQRAVDAAGETEARFRVLLKTALAQLKRRRYLARLADAEPSNLSELTQPLLRGMYERLIQLLASILRAGLEDGSLWVEDPDQVALIAVGALAGVSKVLAVLDRDLPPLDFLDRTLDRAIASMHLRAQLSGGG
jgi:AcrR family transcriptional regulator